MHRLTSLPFGLALVLAGCSTTSPSSDAAVAPTTTAAPASTTASPGAAMLAPPSTTAAASTTTAAAAAEPTSAEPTPTASATATTSAAPESPVPNVKVANIGMHIGGGPHDAVTKAPIKTSVEPHFDALKRCFANVDDPKKGGDFGLDLLIERDGGKAKVSHPRTSLKGAGFKECMVAAFEAIDFKKPKGGTTTVSYSVRFTP